MLESSLEERAAARSAEVREAQAAARRGEEAVCKSLELRDTAQQAWGEAERRLAGAAAKAEAAEARAAAAEARAAAAAREALELHGRSEAAEAKVPPEVRAREEAERQRAAAALARDASRAALEAAKVEIGGLQGTVAARGEAVRQLERECEQKGEMLTHAAEAARQQAERWDAHTGARLAAQQLETANRVAEARRATDSARQRTDTLTYTPAH